MELSMSTNCDPRTIENASLVADLVEWEAWRTSCPRFPVWEDAVDLRLVTRVHRGGLGEMIHATPDGLAFLRSQGRV